MAESLRPPAAVVPLVLAHSRVAEFHRAVSQKEALQLPQFPGFYAIVRDFETTLRTKGYTFVLIRVEQFVKEVKDSANSVKDLIL